MKLTVRHGSYRDTDERQRSAVKLSIGKVRKADRAIRQAVTCVNLEQASKVKSWMPTRLNNGEGRRPIGKQPPRAPIGIHRGSEDGMPEGSGAQRGIPVVGASSRSQRASRARPRRESERPMVPLMPSNLGGGTGPCLCRASEEAEDRRLA